MNKTLTNVKAYKFIILIVCFALTSVFIYWRLPSKAVNKMVPLSEALEDITGWTMRGYAPLDPRIVKSLKLDDYANQNYSNGSDTISLYIGYYFTTKKVGAAHDPLVCFPGQGWVVSNIQKDKVVLNPKTSDSISYSSIMVQRGSQKELIIFWFQSYDKTNPDILSQKITSLWKKLFNKGEDNAFVRVSTSIGGKSISECSETIFNFIRAFYPIFLNFVKQG